MSNQHPTPEQRARELLSRFIRIQHPSDFDTCLKTLTAIICENEQHKLANETLLAELKRVQSYNAAQIGASYISKLESELTQLRKVCDELMAFGISQGGYFPEWQKAETNYNNIPHVKGRE